MAKKKQEKEAAAFVPVSLRLYPGEHDDLIEYLKDKPKQYILIEALRLYKKVDEAKESLLVAPPTQPQPQQQQPQQQQPSTPVNNSAVVDFESF